MFWPWTNKANRQNEAKKGGEKNDRKKKKKYSEKILTKSLKKKVSHKKQTDKQTNKQKQKQKKNQTLKAKSLLYIHVQEMECEDNKACTRSHHKGKEGVRLRKKTRINLD